MKNKSILLIEDSSHKLARIIDHINGLSQKFNIISTHSFTSGCKAVENNYYEYIILDMSIPTFDKDGAQAGGKFRPFGGREIARKIVRRNISSKIIILTQYQSFSDKGMSISYDDLKEAITKECGEKFRSMIFYDGSKSSWKIELTNALRDEN